MNEGLPLTIGFLLILASAAAALSAVMWFPCRRLSAWAWLITAGFVGTAGAPVAALCEVELLLPLGVGFVEDWLLVLWLVNLLAGALAIAVGLPRCVAEVDRRRKLGIEAFNGRHSKVLD